MYRSAGSPGWLRLLAVSVAIPALPFTHPRLAAAQSDPAAVVCVGSELELVMGANQVSETFLKDEKLAYVTDFDPAYAEEAEQAVREQLAGYPKDPLRTVRPRGYPRGGRPVRRGVPAR